MPGSGIRDPASEGSSPSNKSSTASVSAPASLAADAGIATTGIWKPIITRVPSGRSASRLATISAVSRTTSCPHWRQNVRPIRA